MSENIFRSDILDVYRKCSTIVSHLKNKMGNCIIINGYEMNEYLASQRRNSPSSSKTPKVIYEKQVKDIVKNCNTICSNGNLGNSYVSQTVTYALTQSDVAYDIIFLASHDYMTSPYDSIKFHGFLITKNGYFEKYNKSLTNTVTLSLICVNNKKLVSIKSSILIGAYIAMVRLSNYSQICALQLANGYTNVKGLCAYTKFGFREDMDICSDDDDYYMVGMTILNLDLVYPTLKSIVDVVVGYPLKYRIKDDPNMILCKYKLHNNAELLQKQKKLAHEFQVAFKTKTNKYRYLNPLMKDYHEANNYGNIVDRVPQNINRDEFLRTFIDIGRLKHPVSSASHRPIRLLDVPQSDVLLDVHTSPRISPHASTIRSRSRPNSKSKSRSNSKSPVEPKPLFGPKPKPNPPPRTSNEIIYISDSDEDD